MIDGMFAFDQHCHSFPQTETIWGTIGATVDEQIERMDRNGIDMSVSMAIFRMTPEEQWELTKYTIEAVQKFPDRLIGFMWATPMWGERALQDIRAASSEGIRGIKLYAPGQGNFPLDSPMLDPIMALAEELSLVVMAHTDVDSKVCHPLLGLRLAKRNPRVPVVLSHMGMNSDVTHFVPDWVQEAANCYLDTSASPNLPKYVYKTPMAVIPSRMLFGSDAPTLSTEVELKKIEIAEELYGLTKDEKRMILGTNAAQLYGLDISKFLSLK